MARLITTLVLIAVVVGVVLAATGVLRFQNTKDESIITIDKKELKEKAQGMAKEATKTEGKILDKTSQTLHKAAERLRGSSDVKKNPPAKALAGDDKNGGQPDAGSRAPGTVKGDLDRQPPQ
jgi:hypothetical protein